MKEQLEKLNLVRFEQRIPVPISEDDAARWESFADLARQCAEVVGSIAGVDRDADDANPFSSHRHEAILKAPDEAYVVRIGILRPSHTMTPDDEFSFSLYRRFDPHEAHAGGFQYGTVIEHLMMPWFYSRETLRIPGEASELCTFHTEEINWLATMVAQARRTYVSRRELSGIVDF